MQESRDIIAGTFRLSGASGSSACRVNGVFEPSNESQNSFPVYRKKGDSDIWIELVYGVSGWRWYLKLTASKGPDNSLCFAYIQCAENKVILPSEHSIGWTVHTDKGFVIQDVTATSESDLPLPDHLKTLIAEGEAMVTKKYEDKIFEETREAVPGSFKISGATGKSQAMVNGTYEPTIETQNGFPIYRKKGEEDLWIEIGYMNLRGWRWYLKPTACKGPDCWAAFAYAQCDEDSVSLPAEEKEWYVQTNEGFPVQPLVLERVGGSDPDDVQRRLQEGKAVVLRKKNERETEESQGALPGSFRIAGATSKSATKTNGVFEPTEEVQNCMPVYRKKGDPDRWIELVHTTSGWRWLLKDTADKGPDNELCKSSYTHDGNNVKLPIYCTSDWYTDTASGFQAQPSIKVYPVHDNQQPAHVKKLLKEEGWKKLYCI